MEERVPRRRRSGSNLQVGTPPNTPPSPSLVVGGSGSGDDIVDGLPSDRNDLNGGGVVEIHFPTEAIEAGGVAMGGVAKSETSSSGGGMLSSSASLSDGLAVQDQIAQDVSDMLFSPMEPLESFLTSEIEAFTAGSEAGSVGRFAGGALARDGSTAVPNRNRTGVRRKMQLFFILVFLVLFVMAMIFLPIQSMMTELVQNLEDMVDTVGLFWSALIFCIVYMCVVVAMLPAVVLTLAAGVIFKLVWGTVIVWTGMFLGCCCAFLIGRLLCREWVENMAAGISWFKLADDAIGLAGWKIVLLLRLSPLVPYNVLNYVLALTKISFTDYAWASFVGMFPGVLMFTYLGSVASDFLKGGTPWWYLILGAFLTILSVILMNVITAREVRKLMEQQREEHIARESSEVDETRRSDEITV